MDVIHTMYQSEEDYFNNDGITFKEQMMNDSQFKEITICARINLDYFSAKEKYIRMFRLSDGKGKEKYFALELVTHFSQRWERENS